MEVDNGKWVVCGLTLQNANNMNLNNEMTTLELKANQNKKLILS